MCVFCKIINNEIPCYKVYEDDQVIAFLDISQVTHGHTLVIPKKHYENIFVLDEAIAGELYKAVVKVSNILKKGLNLTDLNIINNNGPVAGQTVNHYHIHLVPRYPDDGVSFFIPPIEVNHDKLANLLEQILNNQ